MKSPHEQHGCELPDTFGLHPDSAAPNAAGALFTGLAVGLLIVVPVWALIAYAWRCL